MSELNEYLSFAKELAEEAGNIIKTNYRLGVEKEWKEDNTPLTKTDIEINKLVIESVKSKYPEHGVVGEEESFSEDAEFVWVCDPIDGTIPFTIGLPVSTFSLALVKNGKSLVGVINDPMGDRLYSAAMGSGAFLNDELIKVSKDTDLLKVVIDLEIWSDRDTPIRGIRDLLIEKDARPISLCSAAYAGSLVAAGQFGAMIFNKPYPWDIAALKVIVEEAGGKVTDLRGKERPTNKTGYGALVSNSRLHNQLLQIINELLIK